MRKVKWIDESGYKHEALIRDTDSELVAREGQGISLDPPDIEAIDWNGVKRELHNQLLQRGLITKQDVEKAQNGVTAAILAAIRTKVLKLYRG